MYDTVTSVTSVKLLQEFSKFSTAYYFEIVVQTLVAHFVIHTRCGITRIFQTAVIAL